MTAAYLSLGCNLGDCRATLLSAISRLSADESISVKAVSSVYITEPVGEIRQPDFINMALELDTSLAPAELLSVCRAIESELGGRERRVPMGPRTIDIDILLYGESQFAEGELVIPHPRMMERAFMLVPLVEIAPEAVIPGHGKAKEALAALDSYLRVEKRGRLEEKEQ